MSSMKFWTDLFLTFSPLPHAKILFFMQDVKPLPKEMADALETVHQRYVAYLGAFGPEEGYLK